MAVFSAGSFAGQREGVGQRGEDQSQEEKAFCSSCSSPCLSPPTFARGLGLARLLWADKAAWVEAEAQPCLDLTPAGLEPH
jgi:hypothetical protein